MVFAPYKDTLALYYGAQRLTKFTFHRISYVGGDNISPTAVLETNKLSALVGENIHLSGLKSNDPDSSDDLLYLWDLSDARTLEGPELDISYPTKGVYLVILRVYDKDGASSQDSVELTIGTPPTANIIQPAEGTKFAVGEVLTLAGNAVDSNGIALPDSALYWEVRQHHSTHWHPFLSRRVGSSFELYPAPSPEDFLAATNSHLEIRLTATDGDGLSTTVSRMVMPKVVWLDVNTDPPGIDVFLDDFRISTPQKVLSWENNILDVRVGDAGSLEFSGWSDGGGQQHTITIPTSLNEGTLHYLARFEDPTAPAPQRNPPAPQMQPNEPTESTPISRLVEPVQAQPNQPPQPVRVEQASQPTRASEPNRDPEQSSNLDPSMSGDDQDDGTTEFTPVLGTDPILEARSIGEFAGKSAAWKPSIYYLALPAILLRVL